MSFTDLIASKGKKGANNSNGLTTWLEQWNGKKSLEPPWKWWIAEKRVSVYDPREFRFTYKKTDEVAVHVCAGYLYEER